MKLLIRDESDNVIINNYIIGIRYQEYLRHNIIIYNL